MGMGMGMAMGMGMGIGMGRSSPRAIPRRDQDVSFSATGTFPQQVGVSEPS